MLRLAVWSLQASLLLPSLQTNRKPVGRFLKKFSTYAMSYFKRIFKPKYIWLQKSDNRLLISLFCFKRVSVLYVTQLSIVDEQHAIGKSATIDVFPLSLFWFDTKKYLLTLPEWPHCWSKYIFYFLVGTKTKLHTQNGIA